MFLCNFCEYRTEIFAKHLQHHDHHGNLSRHKHCGFDGCKMIFKNGNSLKVHLIKGHNIRTRKNLFLKIFESVKNENGTFVCSVLNL